MKKLKKSFFNLSVSNIDSLRGKEYFKKNRAAGKLNGF